ncbi:MAG: adenosylcobinamide-GDP ribazoletransferase [Deltaproteobacteria bacterium]|nr:adenosylcobinamide-GDP ribazoletransferase [Deltaproteobacteria bacterium]
MIAFLIALRFLTILPIGRHIPVDSTLVVRSSKFYPLTGLLLGGLFWIFYRLAGGAFPVELSAGLLLAFWVLMTGALHLDGLADCLDGCYGGKNPLDRLRIMKDVHVGTMGIVGLILLLGLKFLALKQVLASPALVVWLFLIPTASRWTPVFMSAFWPYARAEGGLGQGLVQEMRKKELFWATLTAWGIVIGVAGWLGLGLMALQLGWSLLAGWFFSRKLCGITGDTLGAVIETGELAGLLFIAGVVPYV